MQGDRAEKSPGSFYGPADIFSNKKVLTVLSGHGPSRKYAATADETGGGDGTEEAERE